MVLYDEWPLQMALDRAVWYNVYAVIAGSALAIVYVESVLIPRICIGVGRGTATSGHIPCGCATMRVLLVLPVVTHRHHRHTHTTLVSEPYILVLCTLV